MKPPSGWYPYCASTKPPVGVSTLADFQRKGLTVKCEVCGEVAPRRSPAQKRTCGGRACVEAIKKQARDKSRVKAKTEGR